MFQSLEFKLQTLKLMLQTLKLVFLSLKHKIHLGRKTFSFRRKNFFSFEALIFFSIQFNNSVNSRHPDFHLSKGFIVIFNASNKASSIFLGISLAYLIEKV